MKDWSLVLLLLTVVPRNARTPCSHSTSEGAASIRGIREGLQSVRVEEIDASVPVTARDLLTDLKDALVCLADTAIAQSGPSADPAEVQNRIASVLPPGTDESAGKGTLSDDDQLGAPFGRKLTVSVSRQSDANFLEVEFSVEIPCGDDHFLLVYAMIGGNWKRQLRWQAPPLKDISDAFGDFFVSGVLSAAPGTLSLVVAHGTPWCTSRFSRFDIDVLSMGTTPDLPRVLWHTRRDYSRGDVPTLQSSKGTFDLRLKESTFDPILFERQVVYRYKLDEHQAIRRIQPIAGDARGFVEEWLSAPWQESERFSVSGSRAGLQAFYGQFRERPKSSSEFVLHTHGPVRACTTPGTFQVEIGSTLEKMVTGKHGDESQVLPTRYFRIREVKDGYRMVSASSQADASCRGADLMANDAN